MADTRTLPHVRQPMTGEGGHGTQPWLAWAQRINEAVDSGAIGTEAADASIAAIATALGATDGTVATIPPLDFSNTLSGDTLALGLRSVRHYGSLASGQVSFDLVGDEDAPGNTYAYGTAGDGTKGWRSIASAFTTPGNISLTVGTDGVTDVDLADLANAGGGTLQKTLRDAKGRLAGTSAATTTDLTEGTNLYFTQARADARVAAGIGTHEAAPDPHPQYMTAAEGAAADAALIAATIANGDTTHAPSGDAVFDALALKAPLTSPAFQTFITLAGNSSNSVYFELQNAFAGARNWSFFSSGGGPTASGTFGLYDATVGSPRLVIGLLGEVQPGGDGTQSLGSAGLRYSNAYAVNFRPGAGSVIWTCGAGTPEGVVVAPIGSLFTRTDGGATTTLYVKTSGTGNTGWTAK